MYGGGLTWEDSYDRRTSLNFSMVNQFHPAHELKFGLETNFEVLKEHRLHWHNEDSTQAFYRDYKVNPIEIGTYLQDKIEFRGMIANVGLRLDYLYINSFRPNPHDALSYASDRDIYNAVIAGNYPMIKPKPKYYFSPRIGVSHPLSHNSKIYFNYGHFVQTPRTHHSYVVNIDGSRPGLVQMGDPSLKLEKEIAYELGCDISWQDLVNFHVGAFYKEYFDKASVMTYAHSDQSLIMDYYGNLSYADTRGIEIEIRKPIGRFFTGWLNYTFVEKNESDLSIPGLSENPIILDDPNIGIDGVLWGVPISKHPILEPYGRSVLTFKAPTNWGPKIKNYSILGNTNLSLQVFYQGGAHVRHPRQSFRDQHPDVWFKELDRCWANLRISRLFEFKTMHWEFYVDASNILHTKYRYPPSGRSGDDYYDDLWASGRLNQVGTDKLTDQQILRTENDDVWWARVRTYVLGFRIFM
jgi:outer membrane receptor protein involved in Fe transport